MAIRGTSGDQVWQAGSQPHINDASNVPTGANQQRTPAKVNCSLVTAAALVTYGTGHHTTSGGIARLLNGGNDAEQGNSNFGGASTQTAVKQNRRQGITIKPADGLSLDAEGAAASFVPNHSPAIGKVANIGAMNDAQVGGIKGLCASKGMNVVAPNGDQTLATAMTWMKTQPAGTLFGVLLEEEGHWNVARVYDDVLGKRLSFADFQTDHTEMGGPRVGALPVEAVADKVVDNMKTCVRVFAVTPAPPGAGSASAESPTPAAAAAPQGDTD